MKNQTFVLPQYGYARSPNNMTRRFFVDLKRTDAPCWLMREISVSGTKCNEWVISYERSWKVWRIFHPQIYLFLVLAETKSVAQKIAKIISPSEIEFYFSEGGYICSEFTHLKLVERIYSLQPNLTYEKKRFSNNYGGGSFSTWKE